MLTRKFLSALGIENDKVDEIISAHTDTVNALKEQRDTYKADAEKLPTVQKELDDMKAAAEKNGKDAYKVKYDALKEDFDAFKAQQEEKEKHAKKADAYKALLQEVGISEKRIKSVLKVSDVDSVEFDDEGKVKDADALKKSISEEWADFIVQKETTGAKTATPPAGNGGQTFSMAEIYKKDEHGRYIMDATERQKAIAQNIVEGDE